MCVCACVCVFIFMSMCVFKYIYIYIYMYHHHHLSSSSSSPPPSCADSTDFPDSFLPFVPIYLYGEQHSTRRQPICREKKHIYKLYDG